MDKDLTDQTYEWAMDHFMVTDSHPPLCGHWPIHKYV